MRVGFGNGWREGYGANGRLRAKIRPLHRFVMGISGEYAERNPLRGGWVGNALGGQNRIGDAAKCGPEIGNLGVK
jgi:hypothetical protein